MSQFEKKVRKCALALFEARILSKQANPEPVKEIIRKIFQPRSRKP